MTASTGAGDRSAAEAVVPENPEMPFEVQGEETVWDGRRFIRMASVRIGGPDGERFEREVVHHPGAVAAVPLHDDGTVTLVHQFRAPLGRGMWEIPAGLRDVDGEPLEATAARELAEEVGLRAARLTPMYTFHNSPGFSDEEVTIFLAQDLSAVPDSRHGPEEEHMVVARLHLRRALQMVDDGVITDAKTVIGLLGVRDRSGT